jgi:hypothetical protein
MANYCFLRRSLLTNLMLVLASFVSFSQPDLPVIADIGVKWPAYTGNTHPKILFDEGHYNFHTSSGSYKPFADLLRNDGYVVTANHSAITAQVLKGFDVFICSNAFATGRDSAGRLPDLPAFTAAECHYLKEWVKQGGALWLIADHEPAGSASAILADSFSVNMSKSFTADPKNFDRIALDASWIRYSDKNKNLGNHPILKGRNPEEKINNILSFTGQSLKGPKESIPLLLLSTEAYDVINIEDALKASTVPARKRCQALAMPYGKGRVVIWGEAAMLTVQFGPDGMNYPGTDNKQLVLNVAHWLTRLL